ncbi:hypothetical protein J6590_029330 [Homalodisca vitripennis]|nr:hypothetical protein J6590_029330 [Homalodisca vitripennis]
MNVTLLRINWLSCLINKEMKQSRPDSESVTNKYVFLLRTRQGSPKIVPSFHTQYKQGGESTNKSLWNCSLLSHCDFTGSGVRRGMWDWATAAKIKGETFLVYSPGRVQDYKICCVRKIVFVRKDHRK